MYSLRQIPPSSPVTLLTMSHTFLPLGDGSVNDRRAQVQREDAERAMDREKQLATQASPFNTPEERIRIWERLHALPLPRNANHTLLRVIAAQTELTVAQVQEEQQRRAALRNDSAVPPATPV